MPPVQYRIFPKNPAAHLFEVSVTVAEPDPAGQKFMLPAWIPGSYMVRDFARNIVAISAHHGAAGGAGDASRANIDHIAKIDKATWQCPPGIVGPLTVTCEIYAWDPSVRGAYLDETRAFFNGSSVFLLPLGHEKAACEIDIQAPAGEKFADWKIATSLRQTPANTGLPGQNAAESRTNAGVSDSNPKTFGRFHAAHYDELIDHPVEIGTFTYASFEACNVTHHIALTGRHRADMARLCTDLKKICESQIRLFEPETAAAPMDEYWFLILATNEPAPGGLEHRASSVLLCNREELPLATERRLSANYRRLLTLASHEYFHTWNIKRIKPEVFVDYDLTAENYTRQLWFFEGITNYYDELMLVRTRLIEPLAYLEIVAEHIGRVHQHAGRLKQSVAESSFDAWVKFYRQDENSPNATVSYYEKGALVGMALDLLIRRHTAGTRSLDDVMRALWNEHGKTGRGVAEDGVQKIAERIAGVSLDEFFAYAVYGTRDLDFAPLLDPLAIELSWKMSAQALPDEPAAVALGARVGSDPNGDAKLLLLYDDGAAQRAGMSAGDAVLAIDGLRVSGATLERRVRTYVPGDTIVVTAFRRDELMTFNVTLLAQTARTCSLVMRDTPIDAKGRRNAWMFG